MYSKFPFKISNLKKVIERKKCSYWENSKFFDMGEKILRNPNFQRHQRKFNRHFTIFQRQKKII